jgi:hypothetical protein
MSEKEREATEKNKPTEIKRWENFKGTALRWFKALDSPVGFLIAVLTGAAIYFAVIDWRVNRLVNDPDFVAKVARRSRPAIVFDADRRLLSDSGAYRFLEGVPEVELNVIDETVKSGLEIPYTFTRIIVRPKVPLASPPIVEALDSGDVSVKARQIAGIDWEIRIEGRAINITADGGPVVSLAPYRFRLEIIPPSDAP